MNNFQEFLRKFTQVKQNFNGNPQEAVQKIVAQNNIPQSELNQLQNTASMIMQFMK